MYRLIILLLFTAAVLPAQILREPMKLDPEQEAWLMNDLEEASRILHGKMTGSVKDPVLLYNMGYVHQQLGETREALGFFQRAIDQNPEDPYPYIGMAEIYEASGNVLGALTQLRRAVDSNGDNYDVRLALARLNVLNGKQQEAVQIYLDLIGQFGDELAPRVALAAIYRKQKKYQEARKVLEGNEKIYPEDILLKEKARLYRAMGATDQAAEFLVQMCDDYPNNAAVQQYRDTLLTVYGVTFQPKEPLRADYKYRIKPDERLDYIVKYGFITLGWLNVRMLDARIIDGRKVYPIRFFVNSNPSFGMIIDLHALYEAHIDAETMNTVRSRAYTQGDGRYLAREYNFLYGESKFRAQIVYTDGRFDKVEKPLPRYAQDGVSMLYYARGVISNRTGGTTTVVIDEEYKFGHIQYLNETEVLEVNDQDVEAVKIFARAEFKGVAGMNGDAWGWFSSDPQHVPLRGKVSIIVGSITLDVDEDAGHNVIDGKE